MLRNRPRLTGFLIGLAVTAVVCIALIANLRANTFELQSLDRRFVYLSDLKPDPRIVHVDIDDNALDRVGRWPWSRDRTADLIRTLHELGASVIAVDLLFDDREPPIIEDPVERDSDIDPGVAILGSRGWIPARLTDDELADAIRSAGNVFLSVNTPGATESSTPDDILRRRAVELLVRNFTQNEQDLAVGLGAPVADVTKIIAGAKTIAARRRVTELLGADPKRDLAFIRHDLLGDRAAVLNRDYEDVNLAYRHARSLVASLAHFRAAPPEVRGVFYPAGAVEPPMSYFSAAARGLGAVVNDAADKADHGANADGSVRALPAFVEYDGRLLPHLGLAVACRVLGVSVDQIRFDGRRAVLIPDPRGGPDYRLPLDERGRVLIHWTSNASLWQVPEKDMPHYSSAALWSIPDKRRDILVNQTSIRVLLDQMVDAVKGKGGELHSRSVARFNDLTHAIRVAERRRESVVRPRDGDPLDLAAARAEQRALLDAITATRAAVRSMVEQEAANIRAQLKPDEIENDQEAREIIALALLLEKDIPAMEATNQRLEREITEARAKWSPLIKDKIVFVGYAATALGDIVPTPISPQTYGVMCHAHFLNTILERAFIDRLPRPVEFGLVLLLGGLVSFLTAVYSPRKALLAVVGVMAAYVAVCAWVFFVWLDRWAVLVAPLLAVFLAWAFVTLYRQLTAERDRRLIAKQLSQYTSPALAARLAADPGAAAAFKSVQSRDITVLFTDLAGFTTISESESAETIQYVLNAYLECMSRVIWERGLINKFMGDGVMAFFNASVYPQPDHPRVALEVILDGFDALERLKADEAAGPYAALFARIGMRAGLATGVCKNGDFGSEIKADYTVIGDTVNLAARLEPANKVFGTRLIVPESTRERVADHFEFRYLAELQVKGKQRTVPVYEVLGRKGTIDAATREYVERFEAGVALYRARKWDECVRHFMRILARRPDDAGAGRYIDASEEMKSFPPDDDWNGALELKEK